MTSLLDFGDTLLVDAENKMVCFSSDQAKVNNDLIKVAIQVANPLKIHDSVSESIFTLSATEENQITSLMMIDGNQTPLSEVSSADLEYLTVIFQSPKESTKNDVVVEKLTAIIKSFENYDFANKEQFFWTSPSTVMFLNDKFRRLSQGSETSVDRRLQTTKSWIELTDYLEAQVIVSPLRGPPSNDPCFFKDLTIVHNQVYLYTRN